MTMRAYFPLSLLDFVPGPPLLGAAAVIKLDIIGCTAARLRLLRQSHWRALSSYPTPRALRPQSFGHLR